jgi:hypothetical protein
LQFDGVANTVAGLYSQGVNFTITDAGTYMAWVKSNGWNANDAIISSATTNRGYMLRPQNSKAECLVYNLSGSSTYRYSATLNNNTWYHVTCVYNGTQVLLYLNGVDAGTPSGVITGGVSSYYRLNIGSSNSGTSFFNGTIDEVMMWNRSLSAQEIVNIYTNESIGMKDPNMNTTDLALSISFNETTGAKAQDSANTSLQGSVNGYYRPSWTGTGGKYGGAYVFNKENYITIPTQPLGENITLTAWIKTNSSTRQFVHRLSANLLFTEVNPTFQFRQGGSSIAGTKNLEDNQWHFVVATQKRINSTTGQCDIYVDGVWEAQGNRTTIYLPSGTSYIGIYDGGSYGFNGSIDDVMVFNRSLGADEIKSIYESGYRNVMKAETTLGETWKADITPNDGLVEGLTYTTSEMPIQTLSSPILFRPNAGNVTVFERKPWLEWFNSALDFVNYEVMVSNDSEFANILARGLDIASGSGTHSEAWGNLTSYQNSTALPVDALNYWKVRAYSEGEYGTWSTFEYFTIPSVVSVNFTVNTINFGSLLSTAENDTTSNNPYPFVIQNDGNVLVNGTVTSTYLWTTAPEPSKSYQYKFRVNETGAFNETLSKMNWENCTDTASELANLAELLYEMNQRAVFMDIKIAPPSDEPAGAKNATITLNVEIAE